MSFSRRNFLTTSAMGSIALSLDAQTTRKADGKAAEQRTEAPPITGKTVILSKYTGKQTIDDAYKFLLNGGDTLDAAIMVGKAQEDDPNDDTVGLGGLPNEDGVVELDSCCMHGPTRRAGSVGAVRNIKNVSLLAKAVMEHTGHVMLVGEGAEKFGYAMGFPKENLLTEQARKTWLLWKETHVEPGLVGAGIGRSQVQCRPKARSRRPTCRNCWKQKMKRLYAKAEALGIPPDDARTRHSSGAASAHRNHPRFRAQREGRNVGHDHHQRTGLEACGPRRAIRRSSALDATPIQDVGSAGATGSGEENIKVCGAHSIIDNMRRGMSPKEAGHRRAASASRARTRRPRRSCVSSPWCITSCDAMGNTPP